MTPPADPERYKHHRFPGAILHHGVWLYAHFPLSDGGLHQGVRVDIDW
jgi:hypothetical protein